ncbi:MAG: helix-turn-helix domain-containing protein [Chloroflexi bacterium]|jgi:excisionase family DNA binding protein|nr:helix-turn-helix domain-containing protein [Chloroflexota bacterium]
MDRERRSLLTAKEAAQYLRVSLLTLSKIEKEGDLVPFRTPGGHRRYSIEMLNAYLENSRENRRRCGPTLA